MSDVVIVTPSAAGLLNHSIALALCLEAGGLSALLVSGSEARPHLEHIGAPIRFRCLESHSISFNRREVARMSHIQQVTDPAWCEASARELLEVVDQEQPRLLIAKNSPQVPLVSAMSKLPWAAYLTGGPMHLDASRNPIAAKIGKEALGHIQELSRKLAGISIFETPDDLVLSPHMNLIRGTPSLFPTEAQPLATNSRPFLWAGALTFDGCSAENGSAGPEYTSEIFLTFGTVCFDEQLYRRVMGALSPLPRSCAITSMHVPLESILSAEFPDASHIVTARYVPNELALRHAHVVIHHGGVGTSLAAVLAGVPQLVCPLNTSTSCQEYHADNLAEHGVARTIRPHEINPDSMRGLLDELSSPAVRDSAQRLARSTRAEHDLHSSNLAYKLMETMYV